MMTKCKIDSLPFDNANHDAIVFNVTDHSLFIDKGIT